MIEFKPCGPNRGRRASGATPRSAGRGRHRKGLGGGDLAKHRVQAPEQQRSHGDRGVDTTGRARECERATQRAHTQEQHAKGAPSICRDARSGAIAPIGFDSRSRARVPCRWRHPPSTSSTSAAMCSSTASTATMSGPFSHP